MNFTNHIQPNTKVTGLESYIPIIIAILSFVFYGYVSYTIPVICLEDSFDFIYRARKLWDFNPADYVNGFYPFGYPLVLRIVFEVTRDYLLAQKIVSIISATFLLVFFYKVSRIVSCVSTSVFATLFLALNINFLYLAATDNTDMPATTFAFICIFFLLKNPVDEKSIGIAGSLLGLSYMMRYSGLILLPVILLWIILFTDNSYKKKVVFTLLFTGGFIITCSPQLLLSYNLQHNPFYNTQASNVWFGIYGDDNFAANWRTAQNYKNLLDIYLLDPAVFMSNMTKNLKKVFFMTFFNYPLYILSFIGVLRIILNKQLRSRGMLIISTGVGFGVVISMAFIRSRLIILLLPEQILLSIIGVEWILGIAEEKILHRKNIIKYVRVTLFLIMLFLIVNDHMLPLLKNPVTEEQKEILLLSTKIKDAGMDDPTKVLSFSFRLYDTTSPYKSGYALPWYWFGQEFKNVSELISYMRSGGFRFLLYDQLAERNIKSLKPYWKLLHKDPLFNSSFIPVYNGKFFNGYKLNY